MLCMCICMQAYECAGMHTCVHVCGDQRRTFNVFLYWSAAHYFETRPVSELEICHRNLGRLWELLGSTCVQPLVLGLQVYITMLNFFVTIFGGCWGFKLSSLSLWNKHLYLFIYLFGKVQSCASITIQVLVHL